MQFAQDVNSMIAGSNADPVGIAIIYIVMIALYVLVFYGLDRLLKFVLKKLLYRDNIPLAGANIIITMARVFLWLIGAALVLNFLFNIDVTGIVAALGIGGLAVSLAFKDTLSNLIGGFQISMQGVLDIGNRVVIGGVEGVVKDIKWRHTVVEDYDGNIITVPNSVLNDKEVTVRPSYVYTETPVLVRYESIPEGKTLDDVLEEISGGLHDAVSKVATVDEGPYYRFKQVNEYGYDGRVCFKTEVGTTPSRVKDAVVRKFGEMNL